MTTATKKPRPKARRPILHIIKTDGEVVSAPYTGKLECRAPSFEWMCEMIGCGRGYIEHVSVLFGTERRHMFVDENGAIRRPAPPFNWKATAVYANYVLMHEGFSVGVYRDFTKEPVYSPQQYAKLGLFIFGTALLWEGAML